MILDYNIFIIPANVLFRIFRRSAVRAGPKA